MNQSLRPGDRLHGFVVQAADPLPEFRAVGLRLRHEASGMDVFHVHCPDEENLFAFSFKTLPEDSTGVAHILEHSVLCGSERYPLKDPFVLLLKGSMNTFLNAFTFPDKTVYPASSTVAADIFNLLEVYADAVWFPLLSEEMFRQEGHRLEFDEAGVLQRTGVVWNEMKGNYSTHDSLAADACIRSLFPGSAYGHDSGGDPTVIPRLDYAAFKAFHRRYYHPANTCLFLYGDQPTERWLAWLAERFLNRFDFTVLPPPPDARLLDVSPFAAPVNQTITFPAGSDSEENDGSCTVNWLLDPVSDADTLLATEVLAELLVGSAASPLQRALVDSGLGEDLSSTTGLETELARMVFSVGLRGIAPDSGPAIESLIMDTIADIVRDGFDPDLVEGTLRRFEFRSREIKGGPFGLRLMRRSLRGWLHGANPRCTLEFAPRMQALRARLLAEPAYFQDLLASRFLKATHRSTVLVLPDEGMNTREEAELRRELDALATGMDDAARQELAAANARLKTWQEQEESAEAVAKLPFLGFDDIPKTVRTLPGIDGSITLPGGESLRHISREVYSNGITYLDLVFDLRHLDPEELAFVPLYTGMIPALGAAGRDYGTMATLLNLHTGGTGGYCETAMDRAGERQVRAYWRLKTLDSDLATGVELLGDLLQSPDLADHKRLVDLFKENRNETRSSLIPSGNAYASLRADRFLAPSEALEELLRGLSQMLLLEDLERAAGDKLGPLLEAILRHLAGRIQTRRALVLNSAGSAASIERCATLGAGLAGSLAPAPAPAGGLAAVLASFIPAATAKALVERCHQALSPHSEAGIEACTLPSKVAFAAASIPASAFGSPEFVAETVLCHLLRTGEFWSRIRMKGGAYGASASVDGFSRIMSFSSYRDPNIAATFQAFAEALSAIATTAPDEHELLLAKINLVSRELRPNSPAEASFISLRRILYGIDDGLRQRNRDQVLALQPAAIAEAAARSAALLESAQRAVIAGPEMVDKESRQHPELRFRRLDISPG